jgi:hypothetical protein
MATEGTFILADIGGYTHIGALKAYCEERMLVGG